MPEKEITDAEAIASLTQSLRARTGAAPEAIDRRKEAVFDQDAFRILYDRYAGRGIRYANSILHDVNDSEDAVQEVFCRLLGPIAQDRVDSGRGGFGALFFSCLRNLCVDLIRKRRTRPLNLPIDSVGQRAARPDSARSGGLEALAEMKVRVKAAFDALRPNHAEALRLRVKGGLNYDEIATALDCSRAQVRTWIYRARRSLSEIFLREGLDVPKSARDRNRRS